jgi:hypothetical protein
VLTVYVGAVDVPAAVTSAELVPDNTTVCPANLVAVITTEEVLFATFIETVLGKVA